LVNTSKAEIKVDDYEKLLWPIPHFLDNERGIEALLIYSILKEGKQVVLETREFMSKNSITFEDFASLD
jgi:hypothetical protein